MPSFFTRRTVLLTGISACLTLAAPAASDAQPPVAIGDAPRVNGLRINFRDRRLEEVNGVNLTIWSPHRPARGDVNGLAIGLPMTGAARLSHYTTAIIFSKVVRKIW